ncbi:MAG: glycosyltransferase family 87 protein [Phycisphaerae bacterium]
MRILTILLFVVVAVAAMVRVGALGRFMFDVSESAFALETRRPADDEEAGFHRFSTARHNCLTAYVVAADLAVRDVSNLYDQRYYRDTQEPTRHHIQIGDQLTIDRFQYPPQFLLIPRSILLFTSDFFTVRGVWFCLNVGALAFALLAVGRWCGGNWLSLEAATCLLPFLAPNVLIALQYGNVHVLVIALAMLGMLCIETGKQRLGGLLLAVAVLCKIFPALLLIYLLLRRRWEAIIWTFGTIAVLSIITLLVFGAHPIEAFLSYQLPRIANADAFEFARARPRPIAVNMSAYGLPFKLDELGATIENRLWWASFSNWSFTLGAVFVAVICGSRPPDPGCQGGTTNWARRCRVREAAVWIILLILAQQRSPYLPWDYGTLAPIWFFTLLLPARRVWYRRLLPITLLWIWLALPIPLPVGPNTYAVANIYVLLGCVLVLTCCGAAVGLRLGLLRDSTRALAELEKRGAMEGATHVPE